MVSFRFHLVSLVAVFFALGLGVLSGTTVVNQQVVQTLENRTEDLTRNLADLRTDLARLQSEADVWSSFGDEAMAPLVAGRLADREVVIVTQDATDEASLAGVRRALEEAGARVVALLSAGSRLGLPTEADREALASVVGLDGSSDPESITIEAAQALAARLADGENGTDSLERLLEGDFLIAQQLPPTGLRDLGGGEQLVVAVAGGPAMSELEPVDFLVPLIEDLSDAGVAVAAAEPALEADREPPFVTALRADGDVAGRIATQDNVDQVPGQIGLVLAVEDLLQGSPGHYGVKDGASRSIPDLG